MSPTLLYRSLVPLGLCAAALAGCKGDDKGSGPGDDAGPAPVVLAQIARDIDILFVIDNSGSDREEQVSLAQGFPAFEAPLRAYDEALNLHLGIVSTDVGAGDYGIMGCEGEGDNGSLHSDPAAGACAAPDEAFLWERFESDGSRLANYEGDLPSAFSCISQIGTTGCGFEQVLESMRRALNDSNPENQGFVRRDVPLAIIIQTTEDDCSASDLRMFDSDPLLDTADSELGFLASFRCFEFGVVCQPDDPRAPGLKQDCRSREDSPYMTPVAEFVSSIKNLKEREELIFAFGMLGDAEPVSVTLNGPEPYLEPSCVSANGEADAAVRIAEFLGAFANNKVATACAADLSSTLAEFGALTASGLRQAACASGVLADADPERSDVQPICEVVDVSWLGTPAEVRTELVSCQDAPAARPCYAFAQDEQLCGLDGTRLVVERDEAIPSAGLTTLARCQGDRP